MRTPPTQRGRRAGLVAAGALAVLAVGWSTLGPAGAAGAASAATKARTHPTSSSRTAGTSGGGSLGGFQLEASGAGVVATYEQPDLPIPATPTVEGDIGYSDATFGSGPTGESTASVVWPGEVIASSGSELGLIVPGAPNLPDWPVQAHGDYPQGPQQATDDSGPASMESSSTASGSTASSNFGSLSNTGGSAGRSGPAIPSGLLTVDQIASTSLTSVRGTLADAQSTSTVAGLSLAGGLVSVGSVTTTGTSSSDGKTGSLGGSSTIAGVKVAGQPVTVDSSGVHDASTDVPIGLLGLLPTQVLQMAGIQMSVGKPTDSVTGAQAERSNGALLISINLTTYDSAVTSLLAALPSQLADGIYQLPIPLPADQVLTYELGWVKVSSVASPSYVVPTPPPPPGGGPTPSAPHGSGHGTGVKTTTTGSTPTPPPASASGTGGGASAAPSGASTAPASSGSAPSTRSGHSSSAPAGSAPPPPVLPITTTAAPGTVFRGVGIGLVILGLALAGLLAWVLLKADGTLGAAGVAGGTGCPDADR